MTEAVGWPVVMDGRGRRRAMPNADVLPLDSLPASVREIPLGIPFEWPWPTALPAPRYLPFEGGTYNHDDFPELGTLAGSSAGGTFTLADRRGTVPRGIVGGETLGALAGSDTRDLRHTHAGGSLVAANHSHAAGTLAAAAHGHAAGTLEADAHGHGFTATSDQFTPALTGGTTINLITSINSDGPHAVSGNTADAGPQTVSGSTATAGTLAVTGDTAAAAWTDLAAQEAVSVVPKHVCTRWYVRALP